MSNLNRNHDSSSRCGPPSSAVVPPESPDRTTTYSAYASSSSSSCPIDLLAAAPPPTESRTKLRVRRKEEDGQMNEQLPLTLMVRKTRREEEEERGPGFRVAINLFGIVFTGPFSGPFLKSNPVHTCSWQIGIQALFAGSLPVPFTNPVELPPGASADESRVQCQGSFQI